MVNSRLLSVGPPMRLPLLLLAVLTVVIFALFALVPLSGIMLLHASLMVVAWGVLVPLGVIIARYFKITRQQDFPAHLDNGFWWNWHRGLQYTGVVLSTIGFAAMASMVGLKLDTAHTQIGMAVVAVGWLQLLSGWFRGSKGGPTEPTMRGDHYDMTPRRHAFQWLHKSLGWSVMALAFCAIWSGMSLVGLPAIAFALLVGTAAIFSVAALILQKQGRQVSTYRAIWGVDEPVKTELKHQSVAVTPPST